MKMTFFPNLISISRKNNEWINRLISLVWNTEILISSMKISSNMDRDSKMVIKLLSINFSSLKINNIGVFSRNCPKNITAT